MARRRRIIQKDEEKNYEFIPPAFNEKEFIFKDIYGTKILAVVALISIVVGLLCSYLQKEHMLTLSLSLFFLTTILLKRIMSILRFKVDIIENSSWLGNYVMFMFLGLGVWILMINAPFG